MPDPEDQLAALRDALAHSPDNIPLRKHVAALLVAAGRFEDAAAEYQVALRHAPEDLSLKLNLAETFLSADKHSAALVVVEELLQRPDTPPRTYVIHAQVLLQTGDAERAARQYQRALDLDPELADEALADALGLGEPDSDDEDDEIVDGRIRLRSGGGDDPLDPSHLTERPTLTFADVGGMDAVKEEIRLKIIHPLQNPDIYAAYGKKIGGGILLYGPPGCGKTHLARATAGEVEAGFLSIGISDVLDMWMGMSERKLHEIFEYARANQPCVLFFDEVDALGASRADMRASAGRHLINQFLAELDGSRGQNDGVLILAATNAPWHLDHAFRRPGRFDRLVFIPPPDEAARAAILSVHLADKPTEAVDLAKVARKTPQFSGADLRAVVDAAVEAKLAEALKTGKPGPLHTRDLLAAARTRRPTSREWFATARNYALYANEGGLYDEILQYLKR